MVGLKRFWSRLNREMTGQLVTFIVHCVWLPTSYSQSICGREEKLLRGTESKNRLELKIF